MGVPFTSDGNRNMLAKIIVIYCAFYVIMKLVAIFNGLWVLPNLVLCVPAILLGLWGGIALKRETTHWFFVLFAVVLISLLRYYELDLMQWLQVNL